MNPIGSHQNRNFSDFAETLSFVKSGPSVNPKPSSHQSDLPDEQQTLISSFVTWGSAASTAAPSVSSSQFSSSKPSVIGSPSTPQSGFSSITNYAKQGFSAVRSSTNFAVGRTQERVQEAQTSFSRYLYFMLSCLAGVFLIFLSFLFLPMVVLAPQKFVLLFTLGSLFLINGLGLLKGYRPLLVHFFQRDRIIFSVGYFASIALTLYATLHLRSYLLTIISAALQSTFLVSVLISYVGGDGFAIFSAIKAVGFSGVKKIFGGGSPILPL